MYILFILHDNHGEGRGTIGSHNAQTNVLLTASNKRTQVMLSEGNFTRGGGIVWGNLERHSDGKFPVGTFHTAHQAMARAIFPSPGIIVHSLIGPRAQGLDGHE